MIDRSSRTDHVYRNVGVTKRWKTFENFLLDMEDSFNEHVDKHGIKNTTLDRINNNRGYSKTNCRWATNREQVRNRRNARTILLNGVELWVPDILKDSGVSDSAYTGRVLRGWDKYTAATTPHLK
jgi:hypothetical protein